MPVRTALLDYARNSADRSEVSLETHALALTDIEKTPYDPTKLASLVLYAANVIKRTVARRAEELLTPEEELQELFEARQTINPDGEGK